MNALAAPGILSYVPPSEIPPGTLVASRWILGGVLGKTPSACVYEAEEASQSRFAALKVFDRSFGEEPAWSEHVALTTAVSALPGEGIARAYDAGIDPALGRPYVASERLVFPTLARYVSERGPLPPHVFAQALETLAHGLDAAHAAGIVHGNLTPHNLFISFDNPQWARVTDFCLGRLRDAAHAGPSAVLGFSAPEAAAGFPTPSSDRYSLALLTFFAIVGAPWHSVLRGVAGAGGDGAKPSRVASERARVLGGTLEPALDPWFSRALAVDPEARFASTHELVQSFVETLWGGATLEVPARPVPPEMSATLRAADPEQRMPPVSLPLAGPAYASTLEMPKLSSDPAAPRTSTPPVSVVEPPAPLTSTPLPRLALAIAGAGLFLLVVAWWWLR